jgi:hypothetical protein
MCALCSFVQLMHFFNTTRVLMARHGHGLGLSGTCLEMSIRYAKEGDILTIGGTLQGY